MSWLRRTAIGRWVIDLVLLPSDLWKIVSVYSYVFGSGPDLLFPKTFNEKIQHAKLFKRKSVHVCYADKIEVRTYVERVIGARFLPRLLWSGDHLYECPCIADLPRQFIVKTNQGSGTNIICSNKDTFDWRGAIASTEHWLARDHSTHFAEWQYRWIAPKVLIEELLLDGSGRIPVDYKFFCFSGEVGLIQVDYERDSCHSRLLFDRNFSLLDVSLKFPRFGGGVEKPANLSLMIDLAQKLSAGEDFVRVDLYDLGDRVVFGELTLSPGAGIERFDPGDFDLALGRRMR